MTVPRDGELWEGREAAVAIQGKTVSKRAAGKLRSSVRKEGEEGREEDAVKWLPCCEGIDLEIKGMQPPRWH